MSTFALRLSIAGLLGLATAAGAATGNTCVFTMSMMSGENVNNLDFTVNYSGADGNVEGTSAHPECARALTGQAFASFHDNDAGQLSVAVIRLAPFSAPVDLAGCRFFYDSVEPVPANFSVTVTNAGRDGEDDNVDPKPVVQVNAVECPGVLPSPTSTTTLPDTTTTTMSTGEGRCGFPKSDGDVPTASDALLTLKAAVGVGECALCVCDINSSASVAASDALGILRAAVGIPTVLDCPPC